MLVVEIGKMREPFTEGRADQIGENRVEIIPIGDIDGEEEQHSDQHQYREDEPKTDIDGE